MRAIRTDETPAPVGPYSQAVESGGVVFVSGQIALEPSGTIIAGGVGVQTEKCLKQLEAVLKAASLGLSDVAKTTVFMTDLKAFPEMNEVYGRFFKPPFPARATVEVGALPKGAAVEIEAVAVRNR